MLRKLVLCFFVLSACSLNGQTRAPRYINHDWNTQVFDLAGDDTGCVWLGTAHGIYRYDGTTRELISHNPEHPASITFGHIKTMLKSRSGAIWLGSWQGGLSRFDPKSGLSENFLHHPKAPTSISGNQIAGLYEDPAGGLWVGTNEFTLNYLPEGEKKFRRYPAPLPPEAKNRTDAWALGKIVADPERPDLLWIGSRYGIFSFNKQTVQFRFFPFESPIHFRYVPLPVAVFAAPGGNIWAGGWGSGIYCFNPADNQRRHWKREDVQDNFNAVSDIQAIDDSTALVLFRFGQWGEVNWKRNTFQFDSQRLGYQAYLALQVEKHRIFFQSPQEIWVAVSRGLFRLSFCNPDFFYRSFLKKPLCPTASNWQRSYALAPDGQLYMGTLQGDGLLRYDWKRDTTTIIPYRATLTKPDVLMSGLCFDPDGRLWIGSDAGLLMLEGSETSHPHIVPFGAANSDLKILETVHVTALAIQKDCLWVGINGGDLFCLTPDGSGRGTRYGTIFPGTVISKIIVAHSGDIWVGSDAGLGILNPGHPMRVISDANITDITQGPDGRVWVTTQGNGLLCFDGSNGRFLRLYNNQSALGGNVMYSLCLTRKGEIWAGHDSGLARLNTASGQWVNYGARDGLSPHYAPLIELPDGQIASGNIRGVRLFHPDSLLRKEGVPLPYLKNISVFDVKIPLGNGAISGFVGYQPPKEALQLAYDENQLSFDLGVMDFGESARPHFACFLEGYDQNWQSFEDQGTIRYAHIPPGSYRFRFKAANRHGLWSEEAPVFLIHIRAPFWNTWPFRLLLAAISIGLTVYIVRRRERRFREQEALRQVLLKKDKTIAQAQLAALQARMNPHFLFNCLNSINWFVLKGKIKEASLYLTRFSRLVRAILEQSRLEFIPLSEELDTLRIYLEMEALRFVHPFEWRIECPEQEDTEEILIPPMLLQPLVENAIWHGLIPAERAGLLTIQIEEAADGCLLCAIEDNGVGRAVAATARLESRLQRNAQGLEITKERLSGIGGIEVTDCHDQKGKASGTRVLLWIKPAVG